MSKVVILVGEDRESRELLETALEQEGYLVKSVGNGLRLISSLHVDQPDVILLDVDTSWTNGVHLCQSIKKSEEFSNITVILIGDRRVFDRYDDACGADDVIAKPIDLEPFLLHLKHLLASR